MRPIEWKGDHARLIDQRVLPLEEIWVECRTWKDAAFAIESMQIRGAPAIGITAAYGLALAALASPAEHKADLMGELGEVSKALAATRPTAVNLVWALDRVVGSLDGISEVAGLRAQVVQEALAIAAEDEQMCRDIGAHGAELFSGKTRILTHCNAGSLATGDYGTALGVIRAAHERGRVDFVWVDETRPFLQGARLTAWELLTDNVPCRLICDNMAGHFMQRGQVDAVVVGADRITARGDVANKIGTYTLAVLCKEHKIPFYVAAPSSTIDLRLKQGADIPIEERSADEVLGFRDYRVAPHGMPVANPAFDVTPNHMVTALITERGVLKPPFEHSIAEIFEDLVARRG